MPKRVTNDSWAEENREAASMASALPSTPSKPSQKSPKSRVLGKEGAVEWSVLGAPSR